MMGQKLLLVIALLTVDLSTQIQQRHANVRVINKTRAKIQGIVVVHKHGSIYNNRKTWLDMLDDGQATDNSMVVQYDIGEFAAFVDWWKVSYVDGPGLYSCLIDPSNFRAFIDAIIEPTMKELFKEAVIKLLTAGTPIPSGLGARKFAEYLSNYFFNRESTAGFKQHILTRDDTLSTVDITLQPFQKIEIRSNSGASTTDMHCELIPYYDQPDNYGQPVVDDPRLGLPPFEDVYPGPPDSPGPRGVPDDGF